MMHKLVHQEYAGSLSEARKVGIWLLGSDLGGFGGLRLTL